MSDLPKLPEQFVIEMYEIVNGYVVSHGEFGNKTKEFVERRVDALDRMLNIAKQEYGNEVTKIRHVISPSIDDTHCENPGGTT